MHKVDPNVYYNGAMGEEAMGGAMTDGTTIISCKYNGGIMLAADGRSSNVSKLSQFCLIILPLVNVRWKSMLR